MRRNYRYDPKTDTMVEYTTKYTRMAETPYIQANFEPFKSPIDGTIISDRGALRNHMKRHDVVNPLDYKNHFEKKRKEREQRANGTHPGEREQRRQTISDACEHVRNQKIADGIWKRESRR